MQGRTLPIICKKNVTTAGPTVIHLSVLKKNTSVVMAVKWYFNYWMRMACVNTMI